jgi:DNA-binding MarR family transcriptional regulator
LPLVPGLEVEDSRRDLDVEGEIVVALRRIIRAVDLHSRYLAQSYGLTGPQLAVLQSLERHGPQTTGQLAESISLGQATLSSILERLERKRFVERSRSAEDRRRVINELSSAGRAATDSAPALLQERFVKALRALDDWEQTLILSTLQRVAAMMSASEIEASPVLVTGPVAVSAEETAEFLATESEFEAGRPRKGREQQRSQLEPRTATK